MATKSNEVLAVEIGNLGKEVSDFKTQMAKEVGELKAQFNMFQSSFVRNDLYTIKHSEVETRIAQNTADIRALKNFRWFLVVTASVVGGTIAFLVQYALTH